jgi:hypothetical protein
MAGPSTDGAATKDAELDDYWQFSANPKSRQSGINETRKAVVVESDNAIQAISQYFTNGQSKDTSKIDNLANDVADFMMYIRQNADKITAWIQQGNY